ncbi:MAG: FHA domain-containing protein, partial [Acidimicrobiia bacterium]
LRIGHRRFVLAQGANTNGGDPGSTVIVNVASVSRVHARSTKDGESAELQDLDSENGAQVLGQPVTGPTPLHDGDELEFGSVKGWFIVEAADDPPTTTHS